MSKTEEIIKHIRAIANSNNNIAQVAMFDAKVVQVQETTATIERQGLKYTARLCAAFEGSANLIIVKPQIGSMVLVGDLTNGLLRDLVILACSDVDVVLMNGGSLGGMVNINELTTKINNLVNSVNALISAFNSHTHEVATEGTAAAQEGTAYAIVNKVNNAATFTASDYEDPKIKH